jgi:hypothetical protein
MKEKQYLINESELNYLKTFLSDLDPDGGDISLLQQMFNEIDSRPVSMLDRDKIEKLFEEHYTETHMFGVEFENVPDLLNQICSLAIQPAFTFDMDKVKELIAEEIYVPMCAKKENSEYHLGFSYCQTQYAEAKLKVLRKLDAICKKGDKE